MVFAHDVEIALQAATVLANSALEPVTITTPAELSAFFEEHSYTGRHDEDGVAATLAALFGLAGWAGADDQNLRLMRDFKALAGNRVRVNRHR